MKKTILFIITTIIFTSFTVNAQIELKKMPLTGFGVPYQKVYYPTRPLADNIQTYTITATLPSNINSSILSYFKNNIRLSGFRYVENNPDINIVVNLKYFDFETPTKHAAGKYVSVQMQYSYDFQIVMNYAQSNKQIEEYNAFTKVIGTQKYISIWSKEFSSDQEADEAIRNIGKYKNDIIIGRFEEPFKTISSEWSNKYGYTFDYGSENLFRINDKNYYYTFFYLRNIQPLADVFKKASIYDPPANYFEEIKPFIDYFEEIIPLFQAKQPNVAKTVEAASYFNIAKIYFLCEMLDKSQEYLNKGVSTGELKRDFETLQNQIKYVQKIYEQRKIQRLSEDKSVIERSRW